MVNCHVNVARVSAVDISFVSITEVSLVTLLCILLPDKKKFQQQRYWTFCKFQSTQLRRIHLFKLACSLGSERFVCDIFYVLQIDQDEQLKSFYCCSRYKINEMRSRYNELAERSFSPLPSSI